MLLAREAHFELAHIPYRGGSAAMQAAATGEVDCAVATGGSARAAASRPSLDRAAHHHTTPRRFQRARGDMQDLCRGRRLASPWR